MRDYDAEIRKLKQKKAEAQMKQQAVIGKAARKVFGKQLDGFSYKEAVAFFDMLKGGAAPNAPAAEAYREEEGFSSFKGGNPVV